VIGFWQALFPGLFSNLAKYPFTKLFLIRGIN
jgi:hypothetical protein